MGYPLFMKPYDGGAWVGVSRISDSDELHAAYDASGQRLMHLQQSVEGYDVFARSLSIGPETMVMKFRPELPMHDRYAVEHGFLTARPATRCVTISRLVNAFFRWEFNSCEIARRGRRGAPDRLRQRLPGRGADLAALLLPLGDDGAAAVEVFCVVTGAAAAAGPRHAPTTSPIADRDDLSYEEKLAGYRRLADEYFETDRYADFCATRLGHVDEMVHDWVDARPSTRCWSTRCGPPTRPTSTTGSWPISAGWSGCG